MYIAAYHAHIAIAVRALSSPWFPVVWHAFASLVR